MSVRAGPAFAAVRAEFRASCWHHRCLRFGDMGKRMRGSCDRMFSSAAPTTTSSDDIRRLNPGKGGAKDGRFYEVRGRKSRVKLPSVTTVLNIIDKPAILHWNLRLTSAFLADELRREFRSGTLSERCANPKGEAAFDYWLKALLHNATSEGGNVMRQAATLGTRCHDAIDELIHQGAGAMPQVNGEEDAEEAVRNVVGGFIKWRDSTNLDIDPKGDNFVQSTEYGFAGAMDAVARDPSDGSLVAIDFKTTNSVYETAAMQVAAYARAYESMHANEGTFSRGIVVQFSKTEPRFTEHVVSDLDEAFAAFQAALLLWRVNKRGETLYERDPREDRLFR